MKNKFYLFLKIAMLNTYIGVESTIDIIKSSLIGESIDHQEYLIDLNKSEIIEQELIGFKQRINQQTFDLQNEIENLENLGGKKIRSKKNTVIFTKNNNKFFL